MRGTLWLAFLCAYAGFTVALDAQSSGEAGRYTLVSSSRDPNGLMLNPSWKTNEDPLSLDPAKKCGLFGVGGGAGYRPVVVRDTGCFDAGQRNLLRLNEPRRVVRLGGAICGQSLSDGWPQGHLNWFPVTMTGVAVFTDGLKGKGGDFDFNFELFAADDYRMPITKWNRKDKKRYRELMGGRDRQSIHTEVDYRETFMRIAGPGNTWWEDFRDRALRDIAEADAVFRSGEAVVTGLFNLDLVHWGHSEIHPIYAMALLVKSDTTSPTSIRERWAFFARDRGNEGNCATGVMPFLRATDSTGYQPFRINFRAPAGASGVPTINRGERASWIGATSTVRGPVFRAAPKQGLQMEVQWRPPHPDSLDALVLGTLDITWHGSFGVAAVDARQTQVSQLQSTLATVDKSGLGPEGAEGKTVGHSDKAEAPKPSVRVSEPDELYYEKLLRTQVTALDWSPEVKLVADLPQSPAHVPVPTVIYDLWPPVLSCAQVRASQNPRCRGDRAFVAFSGFGVKDWAQSSFNGRIGLGVESPRLEFAGRNLMVRADVEYSARRHGAPNALHTSHRLGIHPALVARAPFFSGIYAIARPGAGLQWESGTRNGYWTLAAGLGTSPRTGQVVNVSVEMLYGISSNRRPAIEAVVRFAYVP